MFEKVIDEINLFEVMLMHMSWKKRLHGYLDGSSKEKLEPDEIHTDHHCELGQWIHGEGKVLFGEQPVFLKLVDEHAKYHAYAAQAVEAHRAGNKDRVREILNGSFNEHSIKTMNYLTKLNALVEAS
jgi:methyl-accepting chemotaxis protein